MDSPNSPAVSAHWEWQLSASCRGMDVEAFFHPFDERQADRERRIAEAKAVCHGCPVRTHCLDHAMSAREPYGIWGGMSEVERAQLLGVRTSRSRSARQSRRRERTPVQVRQDNGKWPVPAQHRFGLGGTG